MDRRTFIHQMAHAAAMPALFSTLGLDLLTLSSFSNLNSTREQGNILIVVVLNGGNDGLNTLIPLNMMSPLSSARPHVFLPENKIINLGTNDLGLHPSMPFFKSLHDEERLKIIHSVGYPDPNFSHFRSKDIWYSASDANEYLNSGWLGRYIEDRHPEFPEAYPTDNYPHPLSIEIGYNASLQFTGNKSFTSVVASNPQHFYEIINEFDNEYPSSNAGEKLKYIQLMAKQANYYGEVLRDTFSKGTLSGVDYPRSNLADQFKIIAKLISGGLQTRIYKVELGGFDTHASQVDSSDTTQGQHSFLLKSLNDAIEAFMKTMDAQNQSDRILGMTLSEFGRTVHSNGSNGTDHGSVAPMFFFGNKLDTKILGENPVVPTDIDIQFDLPLQHDFRSVYQAVIKQWLGGESNTSREVLYKDFEHIQLISDKYLDADLDGVANAFDQCPTTPLGAAVDLNGCELFTLPPDNYKIEVVSLACNGLQDGMIAVDVLEKRYTYSVYVTELDKSFLIDSGNEHHLEISGLNVGAYNLQFSVIDKPNYSQQFSVTLNQPKPLSAATKVDTTAKTVDVQLGNAEEYFIELNGKMTSTKDPNITLSLMPGLNKLSVSTSKSCQGKYEEEIFVGEKISHYPNPVNNELFILIPGSDTTTQLNIISLTGQRIFSGSMDIPSSRRLQINTSSYTPGIYLVTVKGNTVNTSFKMIRR
ncbi:DUF1501 domain-containing protein [Robertkochia marina]|uniref:DUF1501 domain-containing protein n=1 Tax=Robertkochia marina TaxID=1227945 RepID=A0A4S3M2M8_9FLAO|nr:DUF1501 domain-containing protein [Robertkochia marina]THD67735.1 DUF1501 domain-containing protein [Robertkochia marina]TRZ40950.1 DUF1501 domain-containing protein [Robertkochia marina]